MKKKKTYVLTLSKHFLANHKRAGEETYFKEKFLLGQGLTDYDTPSLAKLHTIRANYPLWEKRIKEVQEGRAVLSVRQWTGKPYHSKQVEIARLTAENGVGIQLMELTNDFAECIIGDNHYSYVSVAKNDGLHPADWLDWFSVHDLSKPIAIIHFTKFRY